MTIKKVNTRIEIQQINDELTTLQSNIDAITTEGSWTPTLTDGTNAATYTTQVGRWRRNGPVVHISGTLTTSSVSGLSGAVRTGGLPVAALNVTNVVGHVVALSAFGLAITAGQYLVGEIRWSEDYIRWFLWDGTAGSSALDTTEWTDNGFVRFSGHYFAA